jgi:hypothetical protein
MGTTLMLGSRRGGGFSQTFRRIVEIDLVADPARIGQLDVAVLGE